MRHRSSFQKLAREKAQREKAEAKRQRKQDRAESDGDAAATTEDEQAKLLAELEALHRRQSAGEIEFEEFEQRRAELVEQLTL